MRRALLFVAASLATACDGGGPTADGAVPLADGASPDGIASPAPPAAPILGPCPEGWREATADGITTCEPWPETGPPACVPGTMALPGVPGCAPLGAACPSGDLPDEPPSGGPFVYVLAGTTGGDGSRFAPFATIGEAMDFASPGSTLLIGRGTYDESVTPKEGVTLQGLCPRLTVLTRTDAGGAEAIVNVARDGVTLRDLTLSGSSRFGLVARTGATHLEGVVIEDLGAPGVGAADAAAITIAGSAIRRCAHGVEIIAGGAVELEGTVLAEHDGPAIVAIGGTATVRGAWIADGRSASDPGYGALADDGGLVTLEASVVSGNADIGLTAGAASEITARDVVVEDTQTNPAGDAGFGVQADSGGSIVLERATLRRNRMGAAFVEGAGTTLSGQDVLLFDTQARADGSFGRALVVQDGASATLARAVMAGNRDVAVIVSGASALATLRLEDVEVRDTMPQADGEGGRGITAQYEARLELERVRVRDCLGVGVHVAGEDARVATASLLDVEVLDVGPEADEGFSGVHGRALQIQGGATVTGARIRIERAHEAALVVFASMVELSDVAILDTRARAIDDTIGRAIAVQGGASLILERALVEETRDVAVYVAEAGSRLVASALTVRDALARGCAETTCAAEPGGHGVGVYDGATASIVDFRIERAALCGVHLASGAALDLSRGVVREAEVGACVQVDGFDLGRLSSEVRYEDNERNLETTTLPVPAGIAGLAI